MTETQVQAPAEVQDAARAARAIVVRSLEANGITGYNDDRVRLIARTVASVPEGVAPATTDELALFLTFCEGRGLNPLLRQVHFMKDRRGRVSFITGIDGLRLIAQRTGEYEGQEGPEWKETVDGSWLDVPPEDAVYAARVGVWRTGFRRPIYRTVRLASFIRENSEAWKKYPEHMLAIRAESHALRAAFPAETAGLEVSYADGVETESEVVVDGVVTYPQLGELHRLAKELGWTDDERHERAGVASFRDLTKIRAAELIDAWRDELEQIVRGLEGQSAAAGPSVDEAGPARANVAAEVDPPSRDGQSTGDTTPRTPASAARSSGATSRSTMRRRSAGTAAPDAVAGDLDLLPNGEGVGAGRRPEQSDAAPGAATARDLAVAPAASDTLAADGSTRSDGPDDPSSSENVGPPAANDPATVPASHVFAGDEDGPCEVEGCGYMFEALVHR